MTPVVGGDNKGEKRKQIKLLLNYLQVMQISVLLQKQKNKSQTQWKNFTKTQFLVLVLKIGATKKEMQSITKKLQKPAGVNTKKYCGNIKLKEDPLTFQK